VVYRASLSHFLGIVFFWSWGCWLTIIAVGGTPASHTLLFSLGLAAPSLVGIRFILHRSTRSDRQEFLSQLLEWRRVPPQILLLIIIMYPLVLFTGMTLSVLLGETFSNLAALRHFLAEPLAAQLLLLGSILVLGPLMEEIGWRGFLLERIYPGSGFWYASLAVGTVWFVWHLPLFFMKGTWHSGWLTLSGLPAFLLWLLSSSIFMTRVYYRYSRSILAMILIHFCMNLSEYLIGPQSRLTFWIAACLLSVVVVSVSVWRPIRGGN